MSACVPNQCVDFEPTDCMVECNPLTGERGYVSLCHDDTYYCNKEHECINPCEGKITDDCISDWTPAGTTCDPTYVETDTLINHKICDGQGGWTCEPGYLDEEGDCVLDACYNLPENPCVLSCTSSGGEASFTYADLCHDGAYYCNADHECTDPCEEADYTDCETCTAIAGEAHIEPKEDGTLCKDPSNQYNYLCTDGVCGNPCTEESTACITYTPKTGACDIEIHTETTCDPADEYRICGEQGVCNACISGYEIFDNACVEKCADGYQRNQQTGECELTCTPGVDTCGENECVICDEESKTCKDACIPIDYLESTGAQYIDTGIKSEAIRFDVRTTLINTPSTDDSTWGGSGVYVTGGLHYVLDNYGIRTGGGTVSLAIPYSRGDVVNISCYYNTQNQRTVSVNGNIYQGSAYTANPANLYLLKLNGSQNQIGKLYWAKVYVDNTLVRDFVPMLTPAGEAIMYDRVEEKIYHNQGSGQFIAGPAVNQ